MDNILYIYWQKARNFIEEAHDILSKHEDSTSRIISLEKTKSQLDSLSIYQKELFDEAIKCIENNCFRAAHVIAWAGFIDFLEGKIDDLGFWRIKNKKPNWSKFKNMHELREHVPEYQIIDLAKDLGIIGKKEHKIINGLLSKRNECAHPSSYSPNMNETIGYVSELLNRIKTYT